MRKIKLSTIRTLVIILVLAAACVGLAVHSGTGTYSSFGIGAFSLLCPLGGIEALLASKTFIPQALISLVVVVLICLLVGRAWCAWGCPIHIVRKISGTKQARPEHAICSSSLKETFKSDKRLWVLAGLFIATLIVGFPVFCLICPVGLTFGSVASVWRLIQFNDVNWGLLVFPLALIVEIILIKKWCISICPIAGLLSLFGRVAKGFQPRVDAGVCRKSHGESCHACFEACPEAIDLHSMDAKGQLADCTRCGECAGVCPAHAIEMKLRPEASDIVVNAKKNEELPAEE